MEAWFLIVVSVCIAALLKAIINVFSSSPESNSDPDDLRRLPLPPEAPTSFIPLLSGFRWLRKSSLEMEATLRSLRAKLGPILTLRVTSKPAIFIFSHSIAHKALIEKGAIFADRPKPLLTEKMITRNQHNINSSGYGEKWRLLRRNLTSQILHPSKIKSFSAARSWVLQIIIQRLQSESEPNVIEHIRYGMFCLLCFMCFGDRLDENQIRDVETAHHRLLFSVTRLQVLNFRPWITKLVFRSRWRDFFDIKKSIDDVVIPLIRLRAQKPQNDAVPAYIDSLLELELPEEGEGENGGKIKRKMKEEEIVAACSEFLNAGTDTTATALQWILANLVKSQEIQRKLYDEILSVVGANRGGGIGEEELSKMEYLKAVVMEGLRRHPPGHFVLLHAVSKEVELEGYRIPNDAVLQFMVAEMGWDPHVWEDPMEFRPERVLGADVDITGSREIKMMPFGAGRRICPGLGLAMLHLEYFVANLVWEFEWKESQEFPVDFAEKQQFTIVMKHPLRAKVTPRSHG